MPNEPGGPLAGRVAIVTGASAGIGRAYALALAGAGAVVVAAARTMGRLDGDPPARNTLEEVVAAASALPGRVYAQVCDVEIESDIARVVQHTAVNSGRIDIVVNNVGVMGPFDAFSADVDAWDRIMRVNLRAAFLTTRLVAPHMMRRRSGSIVNVTAGAANPTAKGSRVHGSIAYAVSKAGLNRMTHYWAEELRPYGIAVNALSPGIVLTDTALASRPENSRPGSGKPPTPEELGPALLHLAAQTAQGMSGEVVHTDKFGKSWP